MRALSRIWHELTRPRGPERHRFYRSRRRSKAGVALLMAITSLLLMTVIVTEIGFAATVRMQLGAHQRDEAKAEAIAVTGINIYRLVLTASKGLGNNPMIKQVEQMLGIDLGDALWQMVPFINTGLMRMVFVSGGSPDDDDVAAFKASGLSDEQIAESRESTSRLADRNFLDFDGDFYAEVTDEDRKVNVTTFKATTPVDLQSDLAAVQLYATMSGVRTCPDPYALDSDGDAVAMPTSAEEREDLDAFFFDRNLERWELIGNLADWTDADNTRVYDGGAEDVLYNNLDRDPYLPKNASFDTLDEVRLVEGWHLDDVWERFGQNLTIFGNGKINVNTAECDVMWALLKTYITPAPNDDQVYRLMQAVEQQKAMMSFSDANQFVSFLTSQGVTVDPTIKNALSTESRVFRVTSTGQVGEATVTIEAVMDYSSSQIGEIVFWRIR